MNSASNIVIVVNPAAGGGRGERTWNTIAHELDAMEIPYRACVTTGVGDATRLTREALRSGARTVVALGGDGTANEVINGFFHAGRLINPQARAAFLAAGTGNDMGRVFRAQGPAMLAALHAGRTVTVDLLRAHYTPITADGAERYILFHAGVGLIAEGSAEAERLKGTLGKLAYLGGAISSVFRHRSQTIRYTCDEHPPLSGPIDLILVANSQYAGGGIRMAPLASMEDGLLDVLVLQGASKLDTLLRLLPSAYWGGHLGHPAVTYIQARTVLIESERDLPFAIDGEMVGQAPIRITMCPRALPVCLP